MNGVSQIKIIIIQINNNNNHFDRNASNEVVRFICRKRENKIISHINCMCRMRSTVSMQYWCLNRVTVEIRVFVLLCGHIDIFIWMKHTECPIC